MQIGGYHVRNSFRGSFIGQGGRCCELAGAAGPPHKKLFVKQAGSDTVAVVRLGHAEFAQQPQDGNRASDQTLAHSKAEGARPRARSAPGRRRTRMPQRFEPNRVRCVRQSRCRSDWHRTQTRMNGQRQDTTRQRARLTDQATVRVVTRMRLMVSRIGNAAICPHGARSAVPPRREPVARRDTVVCRNAGVPAEAAARREAAAHATAEARTACGAAGRRGPNTNRCRSSREILSGTVPAIGIDLNQTTQAAGRQPQANSPRSIVVPTASQRAYGVIASGAMPPSRDWPPGLKHAPEIDEQTSHIGFEAFDRCPRPGRKRRFGD